MSKFSDFFVVKKQGEKLQIELEITDLSKFDELMKKIGVSFYENSDLIDGAKVSEILFKGKDYKGILEDKKKIIANNLREALESNLSKLYAE